MESGVVIDDQVDKHTNCGAAKSLSYERSIIRRLAAYSNAMNTTQCWVDLSIYLDWTLSDAEAEADIL